MKLRYFSLFLFAFIFSNCGSTDPINSPDADIEPNTVAIIVNNNDIDASIIPEDIITQIKGLDIYFEHASVGANIVGGPSDYVNGAPNGFGGLDFLAQSDSQFVINHAHGSDGDVGSVSTAWVDSNNGIYDNHRGNPDWSLKVSGFYDRMTTNDFASHVDVAMFKFCWIDDNGTAQAAFDSAQNAMEDLEASYPNTLFIWWTMPITIEGSYTVSANVRRDDYNTLVRNYCTANNKVLFDLADIECHDNSGDLLTDSNGNYYLDSSYSSDVGHLNEVGATRVANAWWILMARVCGWTP